MLATTYQQQTRTYQPSVVYLNFRTTIENKNILLRYSKSLGMSESELVNRMIYVFKNLDVDMMSCLLMPHIAPEMK